MELSNYSTETLLTCYNDSIEATTKEQREENENLIRAIERELLRRGIALISTTKEIESR